MDDMDLAEWSEGRDDERDIDHTTGGAVTYPEFRGVLGTQLDSDLETYVQRLAAPHDRAYGETLLRALRSDDVEPPAMPEDVLRIQRLLAEPDCDVAPLASAITRDPAIAGRFIAVANSLLYARTDRVRTVEEAVVRIGLKQTSMIVMAIVSGTKLFRAPGHEQRAREVHRHCLAAAVASQMVAREARVLESHAFMSGLLHDIGRVWMLSISADVTRQSRGRHQVDPDTVEAMSDTFHAGFGALVTESWGFEDAVVAALMFHHAPSAPIPGHTPDMIPQEAYFLTYTLAAGDLLSHGILTPEEPPAAALADIAKVLDIDVSAGFRKQCRQAFLEFEQQLA